MPPGNTFIYLPDGHSLYAPEDVIFRGEEERIPAPGISHAIGQIGAWYAAPALCQGLQTVAFSVTTATWTALSLQTEMIDGYNMHSTSTDPDRVYPPLTGTQLNQSPAIDFYLMIGYTPMNTGSLPGQKLNIAGVNSNQDVVIYEGMKIPTAAGHATTAMIVDILPSQPDGGTTDYFALSVWQDTGGNVSTVVSTKSPSLTVRWMCSGRVFNFLSAPIVPHTLIPQDQITADATGSSPVSPGVKVPFNAHVFNSVEWYNSPPFVRATSQSSSQTIPITATFTAVQMTFVNFDPWAMWNSGTNTRLTAVADGLYLVIGQVGTNEVTAAVGSRAVQLRVNGTTVYGGNTSVPATADTTGHALNAVALIQMVAGDYVEVMYMQTGAGARSVKTGTGDCCKLILHWMSA